MSVLFSLCVSCRVAKETCRWLRYQHSGFTLVTKYNPHLCFQNLHVSMMCGWLLFLRYNVESSFEFCRVPATKNIHPSTICKAWSLSCSSFAGSQGAGACSSWLWPRGGVHPGQTPSCNKHIISSIHMSYLFICWWQMVASTSVTMQDG